jgi:hypothetical protein
LSVGIFNQDFEIAATNPSLSNNSTKSREHYPLDYSLLIDIPAFPNHFFPNVLAEKISHRRMAQYCGKAAPYF